MLSFKEHCQKWFNGCGAMECEYADRKCFAKGKLPADVCFIAEAPGQSENAIGIPMVGPAGHLMDQIISRSVPESLRWVICNMVNCLPINIEEGGKVDQPTDEQVKACGPRLIEFIQIANPKLIVTVGGFSRDWLDSKRKGYIRLPMMENGEPIPQEAIEHPAWVLRQPTAAQHLLVQKCVIRIRQAIETHIFHMAEDA